MSAGKRWRNALQLPYDYEALEWSQLCKVIDESLGRWARSKGLVDCVYCGGIRPHWSETEGKVRNAPFVTLDGWKE